MRNELSLEDLMAGRSAAPVGGNRAASIGDDRPGRIFACVGDLTEFEGDAIVNAANSGLLGGGGVDGAIHRAAGPSLLAECRRIRETVLPDGLPAGKAIVTAGGKLKALHVVHTVGPVWHGGKSGEEETLASCYTESLRAAAALGIESIAFPAISTGVYGFPKSLAAPIAYGAVRAFLETSRIPRKVVFAFHDRGDLEIFLDSLDIISEKR
jgi:O-acetyl-ADP-ribose deacetylase